MGRLLQRSITETTSSVRSESQVSEKVREFCGRALIAAQSIKAPHARGSKSALQRLTLGAEAAENEFRTLEDYFVETAEFLKPPAAKFKLLPVARALARPLSSLWCGTAFDGSETL